VGLLWLAKSINISLPTELNPGGTLTSGFSPEFDTETPFKKVQGCFADDIDLRVDNHQEIDR